jgi:uncharacterized membrane protein YkvA (DUF1232 family)
MPTARQVAAAAAVGRAVRSGSAPGTPSLADRIRLMPAMLADAFAGRFPALSRTRLAMLVLGIAYILSPVDLVPESALLLLGLTDDLLVGGWVVATALDAAGEYVTWRKVVPHAVDAQVTS